MDIEKVSLISSDELRNLREKKFFEKKKKQTLKLFYNIKYKVSLAVRVYIFIRVCLSFPAMQTR